MNPGPESPIGFSLLHASEELNDLVERGPGFALEVRLHYQAHTLASCTHAGAASYTLYSV